MKIALIIAQNGFQDDEYKLPKGIFEAADFDVVTVSKHPGECLGKFGTRTTASLSIDDVDVAEFAAIVFVGGPGAVNFQHDVQAHLTAQEAINQEKVLAAICIAPTILAYAGVLDGKKATVWNGDQRTSNILEQQGATYQNEHVVVDGNIVTADGPEAAAAFAQKIVELLK